MAGYDITPVDVPGILSAFTGAQDRRLNQMLLKRKMDAEDRALAMQNQKMDLARKAFGLQPEGGGQPSNGGGLADAYASPSAVSPAPSPLTQPYASPVATPATAPSVGMIDRNRPTGSPLSPMSFPDQVTSPAPAPAPAVAAPQTLVDPSALPPRTDGLKLNQNALRELYVLDPDMAKGLQDMAFSASKEQFEAMARNGNVMATAAFDLKRVPAPNRRAELSNLVGYLTQNGVPADLLTPQALDGLDLSDNGLDRLITTGRKLEDIIKTDREDRTFAETVRHNQATEGVATRNVGVREGALGLSRQREGRVASGKGKSSGGSDRDSLIDSLIAN